MPALSRLLFGAVFLVSVSSHADTVVADKFDSGTGPLAGDRFGFSLDSDGDKVIVGIPGQPAAGGSPLQNGAAQIFQLQPGGDGYDYIDNISAGVAEAAQRVGWSVAIGQSAVPLFSDWAALGAPFDDTASGGVDSGTVRLHGLDSTMSWIPMDVLWGVNETAYGDFGYSLSIESGQLVVGAPGANGSSGEVTVFQEATVPFCGQCWSSTQVMSLANPVSDDGFGRVVDFAGPGCERFAAFAPGRNSGSGGEVFIYEFDLLGNSDWDLLQTTVLTGGPPFIVGTGGMAIDCDSMAFGIEGVFVSVHHRDMSNDYTNQFLILPETGSSLFGASIDISGDRLVVGDPAGDGFLGAVYYYHRVPGSDTWELVTRFVPPASSDQIRFGQSVHIADSILLIGAPPEGQSLSGAVYFIDLDSHTPNPSNVPALTTVGLLVLLIALIGPVASSRFRNQPQG